MTIRSKAPLSHGECEKPRESMKFFCSRRRGIGFGGDWASRWRGVYCLNWNSISFNEGAFPLNFRVSFAGSNYWFFAYLYFFGKRKSCMLGWKKP